MKKSILFLSAIIYFSISYFSFAYASDFKLTVHDFSCEEDEVVIHYSVKNYINYDRENVSIVFKLLKEEKPIACREIVDNISKRADGSEIHEAVINIDCEKETISLESDIFHDEINESKRPKIERFFSGCP